MNNVPVRTARLYFMLVSGAIFSVAYAVHSSYAGLAMSNPVALGSFQGFWPYSSRFLTAWVVYKIFGAAVIDTIAFRIAITFVCWVAMSLMLPAFAERIECSAERSYVFIGFILVMLAHYCMTNVFHPYFIYDMLAIVYYMIVFLLMTSIDRMNIVLGCLLAVVFELNREPIAIALFHAAGWWLAKNRDLPRPSLGACREWARGIFMRNWPGDNLPFVAVSVLVGLLAMAILREILMYIMTGHIIKTDESHFFEDDHFRLFLSFKRMVTEAGFFQQVLAVGFGVIFFLPVVFRRLSRLTRGLLIGSIPPIGILLFTNFITELRVFDEFVPLMACLLATMLAMTDERRPAGTGS